MCSYLDMLTLHIIVHAPHIITHPIDTFAAAPFGGIFTCSASGYGTLSVVWFKKDLAMLEFKPLPSKAIISLDTSLKVTTNTLVIPNVTANDIGSYYCVVWGENKASRSNTAKLHLSGMYAQNKHNSVVNIWDSDPVYRTCSYS